MKHLVLPALVLFAAAVAEEAGTCSAEERDCGNEEDDVSDLIRVYENVASEELLKQVQDEASLLAELTKGKAMTVWVPREAWEKQQGQERPLYSLLRRLHSAEAPHLPHVAGAEVWVHHKPLRWKMGGPHFDKDEIAFREGRASGMSFPLRGTVTYLTSCGGPTVVFNQTVSPDLKELTPPTPASAAVSWPVLGRHITFKGSAYHQVRGDRNLRLEEDAACGEQKTRRTLLVNWWDHKVAADTQLPATDAVASVGVGSPMQRVPVPREELTPSSPGTVQLVAPMYPTGPLRGERSFYFPVPQSPGPPKKAALVSWADGAAAAGAPFLDPQNRFVTEEAFAGGGCSVVFTAGVDAFASFCKEAAAFVAATGCRAYFCDVSSPIFSAVLRVNRSDTPAATLVRAGTVEQLPFPPASLPEKEAGVSFGRPQPTTLPWAPYSDNLCRERAELRLLLTSRGAETLCFFLFSSSPSSFPLTLTDSPASQHVWDTFFVPHEAREVDTAVLPARRPLVVALSPESGAFTLWPGEGGREGFARWVADVDKSPPGKQ